MILSFMIFSSRSACSLQKVNPGSQDGLHPGLAGEEEAALGVTSTAAARPAEALECASHNPAPTVTELTGCANVYSDLRSLNT